MFNPDNDDMSEVLEEIEEAKSELTIKEGILNDMLANAASINPKLIDNQKQRISDARRQLSHLRLLAKRVSAGEYDD